MFNFNSFFMGLTFMGTSSVTMAYEATCIP